MANNGRTRRDLAREALILRAGGLLVREVAARMGISPSYASSLIHDPDGSHDRERKRSYGGTCEDCGARTSGGDGRAKAPARCQACAPRYNAAARTVWTREILIARIQEWSALYGQPPRMKDWNPYEARAFGEDATALRWEAANGHWPWMTAVVDRFGTWNAAIAAAGLTPRPRMRPDIAQRIGATA